MGTELLIGIIVVAVIAILWAIRKDMSIDVNKDGKVDAEDAKALANEVRDWANEATAEMKQVADVNKDGKVDAADAKAAVEKVVAKATKKSAPKKAAVKKAPAKKEAAPKKASAPKKKKVAPKK